MKLHWSPSALATDYICRMKTFWSRMYGGTGIQPDAPESIEQAFGTLVHQYVLNDECITNPVQAHADVYAAMKLKVEELNLAEPLRTEYPILASAVVYAFLSRVLSQMLAQGWRIVEMEKELRITTDDLDFITRPDLIMRSPTGELIYFDLKTTSQPADKFCQQWELSPQLQLGAWAYREEGRHIDGVGAIGLHKGSMYQGSLRGPFIVLYHKPFGSGGEMMYKHKHVPKWTRGLITEYPGGIIGWVDDLPDEVIAENFPVSPIIPYDEELVKLLLAQIEHRSRDTQEYLDMLNAIEIEICEAVFDETIDRIVEQAFPRNVTSCRNHFGRRCVFYDACWNSIVRKDPIASGLYKRKEPLDAETDTRSSED